MNENEMDLDAPATRRDLKDLASDLRRELRETRDDLKNFATRDDLKNFATRDDLNNVRREIDGDFARHTNTILDEIRGWIRALDDKYRDLPGRVAKLENVVFSPPSKRKRKAS